MNAADRRRLTPIVGIVAVLLALLLIALWAGLGRAARWQGKAAPPRLPPVGSALPPPVVPPLEQYSEVWERPLFSPTRSPQPGAGHKEGSSGDLQLTGVIMLPGLQMAILHDKTNGKDYRVVEGRQSEGGPVLVELHPRSAVVEVSGSHLQLRLIPGPSPGAANAPESPGIPGADMQMVPMENDAPDDSGMVTRHGQQESGMLGAGAVSAEARARALKARIEQTRQQRAQQLRQQQQQQGGG